MSKQIAQTVGDKKIAALIALLAAFAVLATLAGQWQKSEATPTPGSYSVTGPFSDSACTTNIGGTTVWRGTTVYYCITKAADATLAGTLDLTFNSVAGVSYTGVINPVSGPLPDSCTSGPASTLTCTYSGLSSTSTLQLAAAAVVTSSVAAAQPTGTADDVSIGTAPIASTTGALTVVTLPLTKVVTTFPSPDGITDAVYTITVGPIPAGAPALTAGQLDLADTFTPAGGSALTTAVLGGAQAASMSCTAPSATSFTCTNGATINPADTFTVTVTANVLANPGNTTLQHCNAVSGTVQNNSASTVTVSNVCASQSAIDATTGGLVHLTGPLPAGVPESIRDHENDVIGYTHTVCALNDDVENVYPLGSDTREFKIETISGQANVQVPVVSTGVDCDHDGFNDDSTISWYSTAPGEQNVTVVDFNGTTLYGFNDAGGALEIGTATVPLVKEWNTLAPTWITSSSTSPVVQGTPDTLSGTNLDGTTVSGTTSFNAATGIYQGVSKTYYEYPIATHTNAAGTQLYVAYGAKVTFTRGTSTCGSVIVNGVTLDQPGESTVVTSTGVGIAFSFDSAVGSNTDCTSPTGSTNVKIQVDYPTLLGSDQPPAPAVETLTINWTGAVSQKQVFLAWAGQRVILEHDWRLPAGDVDGGDSNSVAPNGECVFAGRQLTQVAGQSAENLIGGNVTYVKGSGPGNFLPGQGVWINGSDQATVSMDTSDNSQTDQEDIIGDMNGMCISRVLYESEDPGEVDIEAFVDDGSDLNATKVAFVIYYMKINTVNVSLVTQVAKPYHNVGDYAPGNPWDASKDDADNAADWNVSKDLLVRGRVTGWFLNSNPSGRAADTSNPLNVLPANRWVMPQDWPLLAGGPADPADGTDAIGTAEQFRPYYDIMFAPNNARGIALGAADGLGVNNVSSVATGNTGTGSATNPIKVTTCSLLTANRAILVGATAKTVSACSSNLLFLTVAFSSAPAAGTPILVTTGVPFEGPFSLLDIVGFAADGFGGAALSDWDPNNIRDTAKDDGDVDMWDAPMPPAPVSVAIRGTGFIKQVLKADVYYLGTANTSAIANGGTQLYPNPFYIQDIPDSPFIPAVVAGGGYFWDTWSNDGPGGLGQGAYQFWTPAMIGTNSAGIGDALSSTDVKELGLIRAAYSDNTIARDLVVYSDNHGEFMVTANGDFKTDLTACATNVLSGGKHCKPGDKVGTGTITATADYPDFRGKHFPVLSNAATVTWLWGGYKDVTVENGETDQYKYIVFHAMDRDGFCSSFGAPTVLLHSVLASSALGMDDADTAFTVANLTGAAPANARYNNDPVENVDFLIDSGEGIIIGSSSSASVINDGKQFATDVPTFSVYENDPAVTGIKEFPLSSLAASGQTDECQAWIKVSNSLLGILNVLAIANDDEGNIGFDKIIDLTNTTSYTLNFRWSLITWAGADSISVSDAIKGTGTSGKNPGGNDISASVTAIYGWDAAAQQWLGYFPSGVNVPGANDLTTLKTGQAYWIAITGPSSVTWTIASNVN